MTMRALLPLLAAMALTGAAVPAAAQAPGGAQAQGHRLRGADFAGSGRRVRGGQAGVEIRVSGSTIVARELFNTQAAGRCGTEGRGRPHRLHLAPDLPRPLRRRQPDLRDCLLVTLETRDRISSRCGNGHTTMTLPRVRG